MVLMLTVANIFYQEKIPLVFKTPSILSWEPILNTGPYAPLLALYALYFNQVLQSHYQSWDLNNGPCASNIWIIFIHIGLIVFRKFALSFPLTALCPEEIN